MAEMTLERAFEEPIRENTQFAAGVVRTVFEAATRKKDPEDTRDSLGEDVKALIKMKANLIARRVLQRFSTRRF